MILRISPLVRDGAPCVALEVADVEALLTASQAELAAESLNRAATAARYESAIMEELNERGYFGRPEFLESVRARIESRRVAQN